ncbi:MAG TPA: MFS transporter [Phototrophicaceae bacterium]|nr:MFS transporter [Phototrophicaceae bacterium]
MRRPWLILALICIPVFIGSLDLTIVSAFLPEIIVKLELPVQSVVNDAAWVVTGYLLAYTVSMTFMGRVSDLVGRRRAYLICLIIFMIGSFVVAEVDPDAKTGVAALIFSLLFRVQGVRPDPGSVALITIILGRVIQALGAGALVPVSLALVGDLFPAAKRAQPLGVIGAIDTLGWVLGHLYGGVMVQLFNTYSAQFASLFASLNLDWPPPDWRALFWINLPVSLIALLLTWWNLRGVPQARGKGRFDFLGTILIVGALTALVVGLGANIETATSATQFSDIGGLPPYAAPVLIAAAVMFGLFILVELRVRDPLFDLRLFRQRNLSSGLATNLFVGCCLMIGLVSVPILVNVRLPDASQLPQAALEVGILLSALTVPMALAAVPGGWLSERIGYHWATAFGLLLALIGFAAISQTWTMDTADGLIAVEMALVGVGLGLTFSPISTSVINSADEDKLGVASALVIIMRLVGMTVSIAGLTAFASQRLATLAAAALGPNVGDPYAAVDVYAKLTVQVLGEMGLVGAAICLIALVPALMLRRSRTPEPVPEPGAGD